MAEEKPPAPTAEELLAALEARKTTTKELAKQVIELKQQVEAQKEGVLAAERMKTLREESWKLQEKISEEIKKALVLGKDSAAIIAAMTEHEREFLGLKKDQVVTEEALLTLANQQIDASAAQKEQQESFNDVMGATNQLSAAAKKQFNAMAFAIREGEVAALGMQVATQGIGKGIDKYGKMAYDKLKGSVIDLLGALDKTTIEFERQYQLGPAYTESMTRQYQAMTELGVSIEDAGKAQAAFASGVTDFTMMSQQQRDALTESALVAERFGVAMEDTTQGVQNSIKFFGASADGAIQIQGELAATARALGRAPAELAKEFAQAGGDLAKFGAQGVTAFKDLSRISKLTGMDMQKILNMTNKFDTFEGAAEQAGQLNAALGGNFVNAMDMMMETDPAARFEQIRGAMENAGLTFDDMSYYQKQFYTESLGLADVGELAQMMSGDMDGLAGSSNATSEELIEQKKRAQELMTIQETLRATMLELANAFMPVLEIVRDLAGWFAKHKGLLYILIGVYAAYKAVVIGAALVEAWQTAGKAKQAIVNKFLTKTSEELTEATEEQTEAMEEQEKKGGASRKMWGLLISALVLLGGYLAKKMFSPGLIDLWGLLTQALDAFLEAIGNHIGTLWKAVVPMLAMGAAIFLMTTGITGLATAFSNLSTEQMIGLGIAFGVIAAAVAAMALTGVAALPGLIAFGIGLGILGIALAIIGGASMLAGIGLKMIAGAFERMAAIDPALYKNIGQLMMAVGIGGLLLIPAGIGMFLFAAGVAALGFSLFFVNRRKLEAIALFTSSLAEMELGSMRELAELIERVGKAMGDIPTSAVIGIELLMGSVATAAMGAVMLARTFSAMAGATPAAPTPAGAAGGGTGQIAEVTVNLHLDNDILAKKVIKISRDQRGVEANEAAQGIGGRAYSRAG